MLRIDLDGLLVRDQISSTSFDVGLSLFFGDEAKEDVLVVRGECSIYANASTALSPPIFTGTGEDGKRKIKEEGRTQ